MRQSIRISLQLSCLSLMMILLPISVGLAQANQRIAVLELKNSSRYSSGVVSTLTELIRGEVTELLQSHYLVITKENIFELVDEQDCNDAASASCDVEMGRILGAHYVISGRLTQLDDNLQLLLKVHQSTNSKLLGVREGSAPNFEQLKTNILPKLTHDIAILIEPKIASRSDFFNASLKALEKQIEQISTKDEDRFDAQLAALEQAQIAQKQNTRPQSDQEYRQALTRLESTSEERMIHTRKAEQDWVKIERIAQKNAAKGEVAIRLFLRKYSQHRLGNPMASEAQILLEQVQKLQIEAQKKHLISIHFEEVKRAWLRARPLVSRGDQQGQLALDLFLETYADHPMGNPLANEAHSTFKDAQRSYERTIHELHEAKIQQIWTRIQQMIKAGGAPAIQAVTLFIDRFKDHPMGNPLEKEAQQILKALKAGEVIDFRKNQAGIQWVLIPSGTFQMGSTQGNLDEQPVHTVHIKSFMLSQTEVTVGQYRVCVNAGVCQATEHCDWGNPNWTAEPSGKENHPMNCVDWGQARTFAKWLGSEVDLPSEAEWEYAAQANQKYAFSGSNQVDEVAWYASNSRWSSYPVALKKSNHFGLFDMNGNVSEWTLSPYTSKYQSTSNQGSVPDTQVSVCKPVCDVETSARVARGGSWRDQASDLRISYRAYVSPKRRDFTLGFRVRK